MWIIRGVGIRRAVREFPWVVMSKLAGRKSVLKWLFKIHKRIEDSIDYLSILGAPDGVHPKHRLMGYHGYFRDRIKRGESVLDIGCGNGAGSPKTKIPSRLLCFAEACLTSTSGRKPRCGPLS